MKNKQPKSVLIKKFLKIKNIYSLLFQIESINSVVREIFYVICGFLEKVLE